MIRIFSALSFLMCFFHLVQAHDFTRDTISFLSLGDSYTIGASVDSTASWPVQLIDSLRKKDKVIDALQIRAMTGWTSANLLGSLANDPIRGQYQYVALLIGVNNFYQGLPEALYISEFKQLLDSAVHYCSQDKKGVFAVSIPDYGYTPFGWSGRMGIGERTDRYNQIADSICFANQVEFIHITDISRQWEPESDLVALDGLHPSGKQYALWVNRILEQDSQVMNFQNYSQAMVYDAPVIQRVSVNSWRVLQEGEVLLFDHMGQLILRQVAKKGELLTLDHKGLLLMQLMVGNKSYSFKFIN